MRILASKAVAAVLTSAAIVTGLVVAGTPASAAASGALNQGVCEGYDCLSSGYKFESTCLQSQSNFARHWRIVVPCFPTIDSWGFTYTAR
jgi:hypothetical protein